MRVIFPLLLLLFSVLLLFPAASAEFSAWNSITGDASKNISVDISIGESKKVEFGISSDKVCTWSWFLNGEHKEDSEGKSSNFSHYFGEYGRYNISVMGSCGANTTQFRWNLTAYLVVGDENAVREFVGLEDYTLRIADKPRRIVSLAPSCTEILFAVGAGENVVGVTEYCNYPPEVEELKKEGKIGVIGGFSKPSFEKIIALEPDLIVSAYGNPDDVIYRLIESGYKVFGTHAKHVDDIYEHIEVIGEITKNEDNASSLIESMKSRIESIKKDVECVGEENKPTVFHTCGDFWTAGEGTFIDEIIEIAGGDNIADYRESYFPISAEKIIELDPQVIICNEMGDMSPDYERFMSDERFKDIEAVQNGRVYMIDEDIISRPGPRVVDAIETIHEFLRGLCNVCADAEIDGGCGFYGDGKTSFVKLLVSADETEECEAINVSISCVKDTKILEGFPSSLRRYAARIFLNEVERNLSVEVRMYYNEEDIAGEEGEENLHICFYNESIGEWEFLESEVHTDSNYVSAVVEPFKNGIYGISVSEEEASEEEGEKSSVGGTRSGGYGSSRSSSSSKAMENLIHLRAGEERSIEVNEGLKVTVKAEEETYFPNISFVILNESTVEAPANALLICKVEPQNFSGKIAYVILNFSRNLLNLSEIGYENISIFFLNFTQNATEESMAGAEWQPLETFLAENVSCISQDFGIFAICIAAVASEVAANNTEGSTAETGEHATAVEILSVRLSASEFQLHEKAFVYLELKNNAGKAVEFPVEVRVNGETVVNSTLRLNAYEQKTFSFSLPTSKEGIFNVTVLGRELQYRVRNANEEREHSKTEEEIKTTGFEHLFSVLVISFTAMLRRRRKTKNEEKE